MDKLDFLAGNWLQAADANPMSLQGIRIHWHSTAFKFLLSDERLQVNSVCPIKTRTVPRENWTIYRGPSFLVVAWFGSTPAPSPPSSVSWTTDQGCGSVLIWYGFGSSILSWIPIRIRVRIQGFRWPKPEKNLQLEKITFFWIKNYNLPIPRPLYRTSKLQRSLQLSKKNIQHFKTWNSLIFSTFVGHFCPPNPDPDSEYGSGSTDPIESGSNSNQSTQKKAEKERQFVGAGVEPNYTAARKLGPL